MTRPTNKLPSPQVLAIRKMAEAAKARDKELTTSQKAQEREAEANALLCKDQGQHKKAEYCDGIMI